MRFKVQHSFGSTLVLLIAKNYSLGWPDFQMSLDPVNCMPIHPKEHIECASGRPRHTIESVQQPLEISWLGCIEPNSNWWLFQISLYLFPKQAVRTISLMMSGPNRFNWRIVYIVQLICNSNSTALYFLTRNSLQWLFVKKPQSFQKTSLGKNYLQIAQLTS